MPPADPLRQQLLDDIQAWDAITDHRTGSAGDLATDNWLCRQINNAGLQAVRETYPLQQVDVRQAWLQLGDTRIEGLPMFDGGVTGRRPLRGRVGAQLQICDFTPYDQHPLTLAAQQQRRSSGVGGLLAVSAAEGVHEGLAVLNAEHIQQPFGPPVLQLDSCWRSLLQDARRSGTQAALCVDMKRRSSAACNIQCTVPGNNPALPPWVVMTPKSAWWTCTAERAGGIGVWLALLRRCAQQTPERSVIFTANSGHELGHLGLQHFLKRQAAEFTAAAAGWLHLGANFAACGGRVRLQASRQSNLQAALDALSGQGVATQDLTEPAQRPLGEARNIHDLGGSYVSILGSNPWFHMPTDRWPESVDTDKVTAICRALCNFMQAQLQP